jgi:steroid delta-isomerase
MDLDAAARAHCARFNAAVRTGDWSAFVATFAPDARMAFTNVPAGPYDGREAIGAAYAAGPPDDTMSVVSVTPAGDTAAVVVFRWDRGGTGTMDIAWRDGQVAALSITFG